MSTDPLFAGKTDRAANENEDQERRAPLTEYPEEPERGAESVSDADIEREHVLGHTGTDSSGTGSSTGTGSVPAEEAGYGAEETGYGTAVGVPGAAEESDYGTPTGASESDGYGTSSDYRGENGTGYGSGTGNGATGDGVLDGAQNDVVIAPEQSTAFRTRWREIQGEFIDDPQQAAEHADHLVAEITKTFAAQAEEERNRLSSSWQQKGAHGTEELRLVMRRYRGLIDHMLDH